MTNVPFSSNVIMSSLIIALALSFLLGKIISGNVDISVSVHFRISTKTVVKHWTVCSDLGIGYSAVYFIFVACEERCS